jgi:hypothetical protein
MRRHALAAATVGPDAVGYGTAMTHRTPFVPPDERASGVGTTGGLPGANADPRTAEMAPEDIDSTVAAGNPPGSVPDPAEEIADIDDERARPATTSAPDPAGAATDTTADHTTADHTTAGR